MGLIIIIVLLIGLLVVAGVGIGALALARSSSKAAKQNAAIPGVDVAVPQEWALGHDPEARLHRRIATAVASLDNTIGQAGVADLETRAGLLNDAADLDRKLVAIWSLPRQAKPAALAEVEPRIAALESASTAQVLNPDAGSSTPRLPEMPPIPPLPPIAAEPPAAAPRQEPEQPA
ncbi:hypothetical protein [Gordonia hydrophobica]|uniref:Uncharacterized protein n=1 Tax=Gordonia hydrophobica TaxID=40516 RepID=A0ABZ2UBN8_9ACTN|nr:hypothetical protein [Gordonia hydrophobica]MBM7366115.1 hypothetical protein [Gordonia hydrophobica]